MKRFVLLAFAAASLLPALARADKMAVARTVLLPDGRPAAGTKVTVRTFAGDGAANDEAQTVTGKDGAFKVQVEAPDIARGANRLVREGAKWVQQTPRFIHTGYILVDAPGMPLLVGGILPEDFKTPVDKQAPTPPPALRLAATGYALTGKIQTARGKTLPNVPVKVKWSYSRNLQFDSIPCRDSVPIEFTATTGAGGAFELRPIATAERDTEAKVMEPYFVTAETVIDSVAWHGGAVFSPSQKSNFLPVSTTDSKTTTGSGARLIVSLHPTVTARGRIVDAATGKPVAGATVSSSGHYSSSNNLTHGYPSNFFLPGSLFNAEARTVTDKNGFWTLWNSADSSQQTLYTTMFGFVTGRINVNWHSLRQRETLQSLQSYDTGVLSLKPMVALKGRVIDEETGQALAGPALTYGADVKASYTEDSPRTVPGDSQKPVNLWSGSSRMSRGTGLNAQGLFALETASGPNAVRFDSPLYKMADTRINIDLPIQGLENLEIKVRKHPAYFVQLAVADESLKNRLMVRVRPPGDTSSGSRGTYAPSGYWTWNAPQWGSKAEIQVLLLDKAPTSFFQTIRSNQIQLDSPSQEIVPWTTITADPQNWPRVIQVPPVPKTVLP